MAYSIRARVFEDMFKNIKARYGREIGACYAGIYLVVNYAEGVITPWQHEELEEIFYTQGYALGKILYALIRELPARPTCGCADLRKETLLKGIYTSKAEPEIV